VADDLINKIYTQNVNHPLPKFVIKACAHTQVIYDKIDKVKCCCREVENEQTVGSRTSHFCLRPLLVRSTAHMTEARPVALSMLTTQNSPYFSARLIVTPPGERKPICCGV
jgi:hypothetical protein